MLLVAVLPRLNPLLHLQGDLAGLLVVVQPAVDQVALPADLADGADDGSCAGAEDLKHAALGRGVGELAHGDLALGDLPPLRGEALARQRQDGVARDALEDGAVEGRGDELLLPRLLVADGDEQVHGAHLGDVLLRAEQPQVLLEAAARGLHLRHDARGVVGAELLVAHAAGPRPHGVVGGLERHGLEARRVVRPHGRRDHVQQRRPGLAHAEGLLRADERRPQVERVAPLLGDEALLELGELGDQVDEGGGREGGQGDAGGGPVEALHVLVRAEQPDLPVLVLVGLHALEALEGVVEDAGGRVERQVLVRLDGGLQPAVLLGPLHRQHVVGELPPEYERVRVLDVLGRRRPGDAELGGVEVEGLRGGGGLGLNAVPSR